MRTFFAIAVASATLALTPIAFGQDATHCGVINDVAHVRVVASDAKSGKWIASVEYRRFGASHALTRSPAGDKDRLARHCAMWISHHMKSGDAKGLLDQLK